MRESSRDIAKVVHSNPLIAFTFIVDQIKSYDNLIMYLVDSFRYMNQLDCDVICFTILSALTSGRSKARMQSDGITFSKWLTALSTLIAAIWKRHDLNYACLVKYIACQLVDDNVYDLLILQELICQLTGIKVIGDSTIAQQEGLGSGPLLERQLSMSNAKKSETACSRFLASLLSEGLCTPIAVLLAQHRKHIIRIGESDQLKVVAWMFDHVHASMLQFINFVVSQCSRVEYTGLFGDIEELCVGYKIEPEVAFYLLRPKLALLVKVSLYFNRLG
jgi:THO complex subunit 2